MADSFTSATKSANALSGWTKVEDRTARTQAWRDGFRAKLEAKVHADFPEIIDPQEIANRVDRLFRLHYEKMRAASLKSRRAKSQQQRQAQTEALLDAIEAESDAIADDMTAA